MLSGTSFENSDDFGFHTPVFNHAADRIAVRIAPRIASA
jgi:hypothetical protein